jgi:hypothetical protein
MSLASLPVMELRFLSSVSESQNLPIPFSQKEFRENYVPFVDPTEARKGTSSGVWRRRTTATPPHATGMMAVVPVLLVSDNCN